MRGRHARLGAGSIDAILRRHAYPRPVALLLGEAVTLAALIAASFKHCASLTLQAQGDGVVPLLMAECRANGALRGYARLAENAAYGLTHSPGQSPAHLLGQGALAVTLDPGGEMAPIQGIVRLDAESLAACAEAYFESSVQTPTRIRLAVAECVPAEGAPCWRAGGMFLQRVAGDASRGDTQEDWRRAQLLLGTVTDAELTDPALSAERLLFQLFHEEGVHVDAPARAHDHCPCDRERLAAVLSRLGANELADLREEDGCIHARCQFCGRAYVF